MAVLEVQVTVWHEVLAEKLIWRIGENHQIKIPPMMCMLTCEIKIGLPNYNPPILGKKQIRQIYMYVTPVNISCHTVVYIIIQ